VELRDALRTTGACREFDRRGVDDATVWRVLDSARFAPSGGNRQPWRVVVLRDPELRRAVRDRYVLGWREYLAHVEAGLVPFAPSDHGRFSGYAVDLEVARRTPRPTPFADELDRAPVLLLVLAELAALAVTDNGLPRQSIVGGASVYPFVHSILLAARDEGLGGVMTTVICREEEALRSLLHVPEGYAVASLVALGYPLRPTRRLRRRPVEEFTTLDHFDGPPFRAPGDA
jgi:nitroreductase